MNGTTVAVLGTPAAGLIHGAAGLIHGAAGLIHGAAGLIHGAAGLTHAGLIGFATGPLVRALFSYLTGWVASGAAAMLDGLGRALSATTAPQLGASLEAMSGRTLTIAFALALPLLLLSALQSVVRQQPGTLSRAVLLGLPVAAIGGAIGLEVVRLGVEATDQLTAELVGGGEISGLLHEVASALASATTVSLGLPGFGVLLLASVAAAVSFLLWIELVVRSAAIEVATLFLPLALVGLLWPVTAHWARRLGETIAALVLAKLVIAGVLALAGSLLSERSGGAAAVVQGIALLVLAAAAPFALLRLVPAIEAGSVGHLEGVGRRQLRAAGAAVASVAARLPLGAGAPVPDPPSGGQGADGIGYLQARLDPAAIAASYEKEASRLVRGSGGSGSGGSGSGGRTA